MGYKQQICVSILIFTLAAIALSEDIKLSAKVNTQTVERKWKFFFFTEECFDKFFQKNDFLNIECLKLTISKGIGFGIVLFSVILKVPQIIKIVSAKSVQGLSFYALIIESVSFIFTIGFNMYNKNPFTIWGENLSILIQNIIVLSFFLKYDKSINPSKFLFNIALLAIISIPLTLQLVPPMIYDAAIIISMVLFFGSRWPQIRLNYKNQSTGQLAFITVFLQFAGVCARLFTIFAEAPSPLLLLQNSQAVILNGTILSQFFLYRKSKETIKKE